MPRLEFRAMACQMAAVVAADTAEARAELARVPDWFGRWEGRLSRFREDSELSRMNRRAGQAVQVSPILWSVLVSARRAAALTGGLVTPTILPALERAGYDRSFALLGPQSGTDRPPSPSSTPGAESMQFDRRDRSVRIPNGMRIDLGGVAKGWAADLAVRRLSAHGAALIDAGGDIAVHGEWPIGVADPFEPDRDLAVLRIRDRGVATSGRDLRRWMRGGAWQHHLIDPRTGLPATTDVLRVTITAPTAQVAEAAAKAVLILGRREGLKWLKRRPGLGALLVLEDREIVTNQRMEVLRWM